MHELTLLDEIQLELLLELLEHWLELFAPDIGQFLLLLLLVDQHAALMLLDQILQLLRIGGQLLSQQLLHVLLERQSLAE